MQLNGRQAIHAFQVKGDYMLTGGDLELLTGDLAIDAGRQFSIQGSLLGPRALLKTGAGTLHINGTTPELLVSAGLVSGNLTVNGDVVNLTTMAPGDGIGSMAILGDYLEGGATRLEFQLADLPHPSDHLSIGGWATYRGTLDLDTQQVTAPTVPGDFRTYDILQHKTLNGQFYYITWNDRLLTMLLMSDTLQIAQVDPLDDPARFLRVEYGATTVRVIDYRALAGDVDGDGAFNTRDLVQLFTAGGYEDGDNDNSSWTTGDWDSDMDFGTSDLVIAFAGGRFEQPPLFNQPPAVQVPEASSAHLLQWGLLLAVRAGRAFIATVLKASTDPRRDQPVAIGP
jgi:hypothetical protein